MTSQLTNWSPVIDNDVSHSQSLVMNRTRTYLSFESYCPNMQTHSPHTQPNDCSTGPLKLSTKMLAPSSNGRWGYWSCFTYFWSNYVHR